MMTMIYNFYFAIMMSENYACNLNLHKLHLSLLFCEFLMYLDIYMTCIVSLYCHIPFVLYEAITCHHSVAT